MRSSPAGRALAACVAERAPEPADLRTWESEITARAATHRVSGLVREAYLRAGIEPDPELTRLVTSVGIRWMSMVEDLRALSDAFESSGIEYLVFKGPALATLTGMAQTGRPAIDVDVLVHPRDLDKARRALADIGSVGIDRNWRYVRDQELGEIHLLLPCGTSLDLHWHLLVNKRLRALYRPAHELIFERSRTITVDDVRVPTFGPADTLVYCCMHACITGGHLLVYLKDLERLIARGDVDWDDVVRTAIAWGCRYQVALMLLRTRHVLDAQVDDSVIERLAPSATFRAVCRAVDRSMSAAEITRDESFVRLLTRSVAPSLPKTIGRFAGRSAAYLRRHVPGQHDIVLHVLLEDVHDDAAEASFLAFVASPSATQNWA